MPFFIEMDHLQEKYGCEVYLETGLYKYSEKVSLYKALRCNFKHVYSIELEKKWIDYAYPFIKDEIESGKCILIHDDSANLGKYILPDKNFEKKTFFFLDAHVDNSNIKTPHQYKCPVLSELRAIKELARNDHVICIDDMRIIKTAFPWGDRQATNYFNDIEKLLYDINPSYKIEYLNGVVENDILIAHV